MKISYSGAVVRRVFTLIAGSAAGLALTLAALPCRADGLDSLARFLREAHSGQAHFTQVVTLPPKHGADDDDAKGGTGGQPPRQRTQSGTFAFKRPGQFRFDYQAPFAQTIVADGATLWLYDAGLNQVTAQPQAQALASTPAALIATAADLKTLQRDYALSDQAGQGDGLQWVQAVPKPHNDGSSNLLQSVRVGLKIGVDGAPALAALDILDSLGQRSRITFSDFQINAAIAPSRFQFIPPPGADVVRQ
ncbi:MAG: outer membrane lipoprotein chaperone LolA [Burkholderiaceae bacterium]|jgi:outer membrane lipoprotein carrier protein|nr:outer membrane lipoprotein chaperone LolA [Burkholderiaceae bacterium]